MNTDGIEKNVTIACDSLTLEYSRTAYSFSIVMIQYIAAVCVS